MCLDLFMDKIDEGRRRLSSFFKTLRNETLCNPTLFNVKEGVAL